MSGNRKGGGWGDRALAHPKTTQEHEGHFLWGCPHPLVQQAIDVFGPILVQGYGMSETTSFVTVLTAVGHMQALKNNPRRLASCGRPFLRPRSKRCR